jgi:hypothetical protein
MGLGFVFSEGIHHAPPHRLQSTEHKLIRVSPIFPEILAGATHDCPASIRTLNGLFLGPVHVGVRFKAQVPSPQ